MVERKRKKRKKNKIGPCVRWTRLPECSFHLFFYRSGRGLKLTKAVKPLWTACISHMHPHPPHPSLIFCASTNFYHERKLDRRIRENLNAAFRFEKRGLFEQYKINVTFNSEKFFSKSFVQYLCSIFHHLDPNREKRDRFLSNVRKICFIGQF